MKISEVGDSSKTRSILDEIKNFSPTHITEDAIGSRADHIIHSAIHMLEKIDEMYDSDTAMKLRRRFLNSINTADPEKFSRAIGKLKK